MKVTLINKSDVAGGAAIACYRLFIALNQDNNCRAGLLVQQKLTANQDISCTANNFLKRKLAFLKFILERIYFLYFEKSKELRFAFSIANTGEDITGRNEIKDADIIHIHWINQGYISLKGLEKIMKL